MPEQVPMGVFMEWKRPVRVIGLRGDVPQDGQCPAGKRDEAWIAHGWGAGYLEGHLYRHDGTQWIDLGALVAGTRAVVTGERGKAEGAFAGHEDALAQYDGATWHFEAAQSYDVVIVDPEVCVEGDQPYERETYIYNGFGWNQTSLGGWARMCSREEAAELGLEMFHE